MSDFKTGSSRTPLWMVGLLAAGALSLSGCGDKGGETMGQKLDSAVSSTEQAASDAKAKAEQMASDAKAKAESSTSSAGATMKQEGSEAKDAMKSAGAAVTGTVDDAAITASVSAGLAKDPDLSAVKIDVDTKGGNVSLKGPAPTAAAKARAEEIAKAVNGVSAVDNQLVVKTM